MRGLVILLALAMLPRLAHAGPAYDVTTYQVALPADHAAHIGSGWGLYATWHGRSTSLATGGIDWADDPRVQANEVQVGYGWRKGPAAALVGFDQHDYGPKAPRAIRGPRDPNEPPPVQSAGVLGLSFVLHAR